MNEFGVEAPAAPPMWLTDVYSKVDMAEPDDAIDVLFEQVDLLLEQERFATCNALLLAIDPKRLDTSLLIAALSITLPAAEHLPNRKQFSASVEERIRELAPERAERLLSGLR